LYKIENFIGKRFFEVQQRERITNLQPNLWRKKAISGQEASRRLAIALFRLG
jgi:hypothetical protein